MKVINSGTISLKGPLSRNKAIRSIKMGDMLQVKILEKTGTRTALLDVKGNRVHAEFRTEIPSGQNLLLLLDAKTDDTLIFKLVTGGHEKHSLQSIFNYSVFDGQQLSKADIIALHQLLQKGIFDLFSLSKIILQFYDEHYLEHNAVLHKIIDKMTKQMRGSQHAALLSLLLSSNDPEEISLLYSIFLFFDSQEDKERGEGAYAFADIRRAMSNEVIDELLSSLDPEDIGEIIRLLHAAGKNNAVAWWEFYSPEKNNIESMKCIRYQNAVMFSVTFSVLGIIDIIARRTDVYDVTIYSDSQELLSYLEMEKSSLCRKISQHTGKDFIVNFMNRKMCLEKIIAINNSIKCNSALDMRA